MLLIATSTMTLVVFIYWQSFSRMVEMWSLSTYQHGWLVYPIALYVLWRKRHALAIAPVQASWLGAGLTGVVVFTWVLARIVGVQVVEFTAVSMLSFAVFWAIAGARAARTAAFPLALLLAAVPAGEFMVGHLQESTADIAGLLLHIVGVPALRDGNFLTLPGGSFEVAEVCGGLRYLLAAVLASLAFAWLTYSTTTRRLLFVATAAATMVITNGVRAFIVMYVASATDMRVFAGRDHVIFGMILFAAVFAALIYAGERFADRVPAMAAPAPFGSSPPAVRSSMPVVLTVLLCLAAGPVFQYVQMRQPLPQPVSRELPALEGCSGPRPWRYEWSPEFRNHDYLQRAAYDCGAWSAGVYVAGYLRQEQGKELISSGNRIWPHEWRRHVDEAEISLATEAGTGAVRQVYLRTPERSMLVWYWYQVGDSTVASALGVKLLAIVYALSLRPVESSVVAIHVGVPREASVRQLQDVLEPKARALMTRHHAGRKGGPERGE